ncbi:MAG: glutathione S-transferase family protein [Pseudomonadota bacterium]
MAAEQPLVLHQYQVSPFAAKVRRCLHFKGIPFEVTNYGLTGFGKVRKLSHAGKAPVLEHRGDWIADSSDIIQHLERHFPETPVIPTAPADRALAHVFEDWADESLYYYDLTMRSWPNNANWLADDLTLEDSGLLRRVFHSLAPKIIAKQARDQGTGRKPREAVCQDVAQHFTAIDHLVADDGWLVGDALSIADISVVSMFTVLERAEEARILFMQHPALRAWQARVDALTLPKGISEDNRALL